ncbi:hypothetical protein DRJ25_02025 [Candidatus Woesearchaeota archaeon]|nr:MAG: hypothetical protein DRJ25_02025 [Candidatus Woesearchaeota archaeon]
MILRAFVESNKAKIVETNKRINTKTKDLFGLKIFESKIKHHLFTSNNHLLFKKFSCSRNLHKTVACKP